MEYSFNENVIKIGKKYHYICYDWDDKKKTKTYYPQGLYEYNVQLPGCMTENQVTRLIRRTYGL